MDYKQFTQIIYFQTDNGSVIDQWWNIVRTTSVSENR